MKIHEYQAKAIVARLGVPVPRGEVAFTVEEARAAAERIGGSVVVKAQIHAGGRGKGGGVKVAANVDEAAAHAQAILGMWLVTHQTGPEGRIVQRLLVEETLPIEKELYLGITLDRAQGKNVFMASPAGGMEIEVVAAKNAAPDLQGDHRARVRTTSFPGAQTGLRDGPAGGQHQRRGRGHDGARQGIRGGRCHTGRNQSVRTCQGRARHRARRQDQLG